MNVAEPTWRHAGERPAAVALRAGEEEWSYRRLRDAAAASRAVSLAAGIEPGDRILGRPLGARVRRRLPRHPRRRGGRGDAERDVDGAGSSSTSRSTPAARW